MITHEAMATMGLWPGSPTWVMGNMGIFDFIMGDIVSESSAGVGGSNYNLNFFRDRAEEQNDTISIILSHRNLYWNQEYKDVKYSKIALHARLVGGRQVTGATKKKVTVTASINKPEFIVKIK